MVETLSRSPRLASAYRALYPYLSNPAAAFLENRFDGQLARRWMTGRIFDYGWTSDLFAWFDFRGPSFDAHGRDAHKAERIGKKYQWIAYHELWARLADNFYMRTDRYGDVKYREHEGPWDGPRRDIDPTTVLTRTPATDDASVKCWWITSSVSDWDRARTDLSWLKSGTDLPGAKQFLRVRDLRDGTLWFVLDGYLSWREPATPGREEYEEERRSLYYSVRSHIVRERDLTGFAAWSVKEHGFREVPQAHEIHDLPLGEYLWSSWYKRWASEAGVGWTRGHSEQVPVDVQVTATHYTQSDGGFDCSIDDSYVIRLPSPELVQLLDLRWRGVEGEYTSPDGLPAAYDPSVRLAGPSVLLVREDILLARLRAEKLTLCWTVHGEKQISGGHNMGSAPGLLSIHATYSPKAGAIAGVMRTRFDPAHRERMRRSSSRSATAPRSDGLLNRE